jgi:hypothetical protein
MSEALAPLVDHDVVIGPNFSARGWCLKAVAGRPMNASALPKPFGALDTPLHFQPADVH